MPQTQRKKPSVVELYEQEQARKRRPRGPRLSVVEMYEQEQRYKQLQPSPAPPGHGTLKNLALGAEQTIYGEFVPSALTGFEALGSAMTGDFGPAKEIGELALRGLGHLLTYDPAGTGISPGAGPAQANAEAIARITAERRAARQGDPIYGTVERVRQEVEQEATQDPSRRGRIERGVGRYGTAAIPAVATGIATGGSVPAMAAVSGLQTLNAPENIPLAVGLGALPVPAGRFVAPILRRIRGARGVAAEAEAVGTAATREAIPVTAKAPPAVASRPATALESVFQKLGTDNIDQIGAMFANANRRLGKKRTPAQLQSSIEDYNALNRLTPDEHRALSQVLPARTYSPVAEFEQGGYSREIRDIPMSERNAQLDANLRELEAFFTSEGKAPRLEAEFGVSAATPRRMGASVTGPRAESAALEVKAARSPELVTKAERTPILETISALRKAGLMRVTTHLKNVGGTGLFQLSEEAARIPGAIADMVVAPFTRRRTFTGPSVGSVGRSAYEAATRGRREAWDVIRKGASESELERMGLRGEINSGSKVLDTYINGTFRLLNAEDRIFKVYAFRRSLEERARAVALTEMRRGEIPRGQYRERFNELMKAPPEDLAAAAVLDAEVATFTNPNVVATAFSRFEEALPKGAQFAIDQIIPFKHTPANVIARLLEYAGYGYGKSGYLLAKGIVKRSMTEAEQRAFAQSFGRAAIGSGLIALGYVGYRDGWLTGMQEDDTSKRARDTAAGRVPGAMLIGRTWHQITGLSPLGNLIAIGATLARETEQEERKAREQGKEPSYAGALATAAPETLGRTVLEQPLLAGTRQFIEGLEQPGTFGAKALGGIVGSYVPGHVSDVGQLIDYGVQREAQTLPQRIAQRVPGVRQLLPERQDVLGRPQEAPFPLNPARSQTAQQASNPLFAELVRHDIGISGFEKKKGETDEQLRQRKTEFGKLYIPYGIQLVSSPQYQRASDEIQQDAIKNLNSRAKDIIEKNRQAYAAGPLSPTALIGAAIGSQARERAKKKPGQ